MKKNKIQWPDHPDFVRWNRLKLLRKIRGVRQVDLAAACDVSFPTLYFIENGAEKRVSDKTKEKIAVFFDVPMSEIFPAEVQGMTIIETGEKLASKE